MPPLRGKPGIRGRSRDIVSQVEDKLKLNNRLPREILEATRSSLRVLKIRNPIGCFGKYDNETKRACALLEYDVREYNNYLSGTSNRMIEVPMERLAKAAFMKLKDFRDFHEKIGNFRDNLRITAKSTSKAKEKVQEDECGNRKGKTSSKKTSIVFQKSSISSLAIQLGAFVPNSSDTALRAQKLFEQMVENLESSSKKAGIYGLRDIQRNQSSYEAACFYLIATAGQDKNTTSRRRRRITKEFNDGDDIQQLDLKTFAEITNVPSQFQTILDYVSELKNEIESKTTTSLSSSIKSRRSRPSPNSSIPSRITKSKTSRKRSKEETFDIDEVIGSNGNGINDEDSDGRIPDQQGDSDQKTVFPKVDDIQETNYNQKFQVRKSRPNTVFLEWKSKVLREACEDARKKMSEENATNGEDCKKKQKLLESGDLLDFVVREILAQNGL